MRRRTTIYAGLFVIAVLAELICAQVSYHTIGEIFSALTTLAIGLNVMPVLLYLDLRRTLAVAAALVLFAAIVPPQAVLAHKLILLQEEAETIVAYAEEEKAHTGEYPEDLSQYRLANSELAEHFQYYGQSEEHGGFVLFWYVGTPNTSHSYSPRGGWQYYPD